MTPSGVECCAGSPTGLSCFPSLPCFLGRLETKVGATFLFMIRRGAEEEGEEEEEEEEEVVVGAGSLEGVVSCEGIVGCGVLWV